MIKFGRLKDIGLSGPFRDSCPVTAVSSLSPISYSSLQEKNATSRSEKEMNSNTSFNLTNSLLFDALLIWNRMKLICDKYGDVNYSKRHLRISEKEWAKRFQMSIENYQTAIQLLEIKGLLITEYPPCFKKNYPIYRIMDEFEMNIEYCSNEVH